MTAPDTIVLIHGFWVTPRSWEDWIAHYEARATGARPGVSRASRSRSRRCNADPTPIEDADGAGDHRASRGASSARSSAPPIIMGHSAGGAFTQILLDHGYGAAGVAINSAPTEGVQVVPLSQIKSTFPVLKNPANRHKAVGFTFEQWHYAFTNTFSEERVAARSTSATTSRRPGGSCGTACSPTSTPGHQDTWVELQERRPGAAAVHLGQRGPPHAAAASSTRTPSTTSRTHDHRDQGVRGPAPAAGRRTAGRRSPTTRSTGPLAHADGAERRRA